MLKFAVIVFPVLLASCGPNSDDIFTRHCRMATLADFRFNNPSIRVEMEEVQRFVATFHPDTLVIEIKYWSRDQRGGYNPPGLTGPDYNAARCGYLISDSKPRGLTDLKLTYFGSDATMNGYFDAVGLDFLDRDMVKWFTAHPPNDERLTGLNAEETAEWLAAHPQE